MIKMYQKEWHGIEFNSFTKCDEKNIATAEFYDKFYKIFFQKFNNLTELDKGWINSKDEVANQLIEYIQNKKNILSIGCGIGVVEKLLVNSLPEINLTAIEPSSNTTKWIEDARIILKEGYFPNIMKDDNIVFDLVYANAIDYVFNNAEYLKFLESIVKYGIKEFYMISVSYYKPSIKLSAKQCIKKILNLLGKYNYGQFWGYVRTIEEQKNLLKQAGFSDIELVSQSDDTIIIKATV